MIFVGLDDTDTRDSPGTNQVARSIVAEFDDDFFCQRIVRHQLLFDPRVPYTSKNSCCSLLVQSRLPMARALATLRQRMRTALLQRFQVGSDPGLCIAATVPEAISEFGRRCQRQVVRQDDARQLAAACGIDIEGLGGTEDGVIGALAAVGLAATHDDGRLVQIRQQPDLLSGVQSAALLLESGVDRICCGDVQITSGTVDIGKHLRPNLRSGQIVLSVERAGPLDTSDWRAVRRP